jgi:predicted extracellular nuclease
VTAISPDFELISSQQVNGDKVPNPLYQRTIADDDKPKKLSWERPLLHCTIKGPNGRLLNIMNIHFKSKLATKASDLMRDGYSWNSAAGWAEGFFVSSMKRVGAALEARVLIDSIFENDPNASIVIAGDFNAKSDEVPIMAVQGRVQETGNEELTSRVMVPLENNIPSSSRHTLFHHGKGEMIDHILASQSLVQCFRAAEIHNEALQDESIAWATDKKYPASDHAPVVAEFDSSLFVAPLTS